MKRLELLLGQEQPKPPARLFCSNEPTEMKMFAIARQSSSEVVVGTALFEGGVVILGLPVVP